jgi:muconolactone D-isomerase
VRQRTPAYKFSRVEFLVEIEISLPPELGDERRRSLLDAEAARGSALAQAGVLRALWRVPGRLANCGIWSATDATALHEALASLPLWPYMDVAVTALARHPLSEFCPGLAAGLDGALDADAG